MLSIYVSGENIFNFVSVALISFDYCLEYPLAYVLSIFFDKLCHIFLLTQIQITLYIV